MATIQANDYLIKVDEPWTEFSKFVQSHHYSKIVILVDENTRKYCYNRVKGQLPFDHQIIETKSGEDQKSISTCEFVWSQLLNNDCDRKSLVINMGGGVIGDLGGFCAASYMRGIDFIQIPTTLLSQVDASVGGKLGVDLKHFKNMVGVFKNPKMVWIQTEFLDSLPANELRSGYAEVVKHCLIADKKQWEEISKYDDLSQINQWTNIVVDSIKIKNKIVGADPFESGLRKILNFGHTLGHALESQLLETENRLLHGEAVAQGMILESMHSVNHGKLSQIEFEEIKSYIELIFGKLEKQRLDINDLIYISKKDKKNFAGAIKISTIDKIGSCIYDFNISPDEIKSLFSQSNFN